MKRVCVYGLLIIFLQVPSPKGLAVNDTETQLIETLLTPYNINTRPLLDKSKPVTVRIEFVPRQVIRLNEKDQLLTTNAWLRLYWKDEHLTWEKSDYEGISSFRVYPTAIWRPDIVLYNEVSDQQQDLGGLYPAIVSSDGSVTWFTKQIYKTTCAMDVSDFPWDTQRCKLLYSSWSYDSQGIDLNVSSSRAETESFTLNGQWTLEEIPISKHLLNASCCEHPYSAIEFTMILRRKPLYYIVYLVIPAVCITLVGTMVFCLPVDSGEKVSLSVTVLLSSTVFLTMISDELPTQSDAIPLAGELFLVVIVCMSISTMLTVMVLNVHSHGQYGTRVPRLIRKVFIEHLGRVLMCTRKDGLLNQQREVARKSLVIRNPALARPALLATSILAASAPTARRNTAAESPDKRRQLVSTKRDVSFDKTRTAPSAGSCQPMEGGFLARYSDRVTEMGKEDSENNFEEEQYRVDGEWIYLALVLDRLFLIVFLFVLIMACVVAIFVTDW